MASKLFQLAAIASLAILSISLGAEPVAALSLNSHHALAHRHDAALLAHKKRQTTKRCRPRPTSSSGSSPPASPTSTPTQAPAPAPTTTSAPPPPASTPPPSPPPSSGGQGKVGIAWNGNNLNSLGQFKTNKVSSYYTWSAWPVSGADKLGYQFIPMLWGRTHVDEFRNNVKPGLYKAALGFNEPDHPGQAEMSVGEAVGLWRANMDPLKQSGYTLISPAVTSAASGKAWLQSFVSQCTGCSIDAIAVHYYGTDPQAFIAYLQDFHNTFGKPLYVTEFACQNFAPNGAQCSADQVWNWMRTITAFMDNTNWVVAYYAFGALQNMYNVNPLNQLITSSGGPSALGFEYIN